ncbi:hypothetical protein [Marinibactrum halimedae]|uniref:Uncharacterized protein n=1 Tax=Marinibactrum halimedae TaxID=1444977 RepID=A0AA37WNR5_9GAMM|nr:hypothetical protein [Marinibactrum halimedae]MCD9460596.1 hypothetical protein [Marinibactrum halimedae]GLS27813.1 hypothetical protein GCM10007877_35320 [Marinibactrum halimedae]
MNYLKALRKHDITNDDINHYAQLLKQRADKTGYSHPDGVYHTIAVDIALSAIDIEKENDQQLGRTHTVKEWVEILIGDSTE